MDADAYRTEIASWSNDTLAALLGDPDIQEAGNIVPTIRDMMNEAAYRLHKLADLADAVKADR